MPGAISARTSWAVRLMRTIPSASGSWACGGTNEGFAPMSATRSKSS